MRSTLPFAEIASFRNGLNFGGAEEGLPIKILGVPDFWQRSEIRDFSSVKAVPITSAPAADDLLADGDLVFVRSNGSRTLVGRCLLVYPGSEKIAFSGFTIRARLNNTDFDPRFIALLFQSSLFDEHRWRKGAGTNISNLSQDVLGSFEVPRFDADEQRRIAEILRTWDEAIEKKDRLIAAKSKAFDHWSLVLLSGRKRLGSKRSNWQSVALTDVTSEATSRNGGNLGENLVMGVNKSLGMIPMKDHVRAADLSRYKVVAPEAFAYNPMRLNIGSIAQNLHCRDVLVSPDYVAFAVQPDVLLPGYFDHLRRSWLWSRFVKTAGSGGVRVRIYYDDLADFVFELPPVAEQRRIVDVLSTGRREIVLLEQQRDALAKQKRGLMQKLLTGEWSVSVPTTKEAAE